jgi:hypothetical protein
MTARTLARARSAPKPASTFEARAGARERLSALLPRPAATVAGVDAALASPGAPLSERDRREREAGFRRDFASVRIHADSHAGEAAGSAPEDVHKPARLAGADADTIALPGDGSNEANRRRPAQKRDFSAMRIEAGAPPFVGRIAPVSGADAVKLARSGTRVELPHRSEAQRALGHDLRGVDAYVGAAAEQACDALAVEEMKRVEAKTRQQLGASEYSRLEYEFENLHKRDAFGPEYQAAADRLAALGLITRYSTEVRAWLETQIDSLGKHGTLQETTAEAIAISKAHHDFRSLLRSDRLWSARAGASHGRSASGA